MHERSSDLTGQTRYLRSDHLVGVDAISDEQGALLARLSFDAFGQRRGSSWTGDPSLPDWQTIAGSTHRGYTFHEQLDNLDLVHMNGRVYDPALGRFLSADPFVPQPFNPQSLNRYSYVLNSPWSYTDPSGYTESSDVAKWAWGDVISLLNRGALLGGRTNRGEADSYVPRDVTPTPPMATLTDSQTVDINVGVWAARSAVGGIGDFLFPNITALGQRGVQGTLANDVVGGLKAAYNAAQAIAALNSPSLLISGPHQLEVADTELAGASIVEAGTAVFGSSRHATPQARPTIGSVVTETPCTPIFASASAAPLARRVAVSAPFRYRYRSCDAIEQSTVIEDALTLAVGGLGIVRAERGLTFEGLANEFRLQYKHIPGTTQGNRALRQLRKKSAHFFFDKETLAAVEAAIIERAG